MSESKEQGGEVTYETNGWIGTITLRRPGKRNALTYGLWSSLSKAIKEAAEDSTVRVVLLKGEGDSFCSGLDLSPTNEVLGILSEKRSAEQKRKAFAVIKWIQSIYTALEILPVPTIGVIQGHCLGAGLELACCCDLRFCSSDGVFSLPEARFAIIADIGGLQRLTKIVGRAKARELAFRGHAIDPEEARRIGLVNEVFDTRELLFEKTDKIAEEIAGNSPLAVQGAKEVLLHSEDVSLTRSLEYNAARSAMILPSEDLSESFKAYVEKRAPQFKGR